MIKKLESLIMNCTICKIELIEFCTRQPYNGIHIQTSGHYGSSVIDSMCNEEVLHIYICDNCLNKGLIDKTIIRELIS